MASSKFRLLDISGCSVDDQPIAIDWLKCTLCQEIKNERLITPFLNPRGASDGYNLLATNLTEFYEIGALPLHINIKGLDDGSGIKSTLEKNMAVWHRSCYLQVNNTKLIRAKAKREREEQEGTVDPSPKKTRNVCPAVYDQTTCLFCGMPPKRGETLHFVNRESDEYIRKKVNLFRDSKLLGKVSDRHDLQSLKARYHGRCYTDFRNKVRSVETPKADGSNEKQIEGLALAGLIAFLNDSRKQGEVPPVFKMKQISDLYAEGMRELGVKCDVHVTRLKERILQECPYLHVMDKKGRGGTYITFKEDVDTAVRDSCRNFDTEGKALFDVAKLIREDILSAREGTVSGGNRIPSLITLIKMILRGPRQNIDSEANEEENTAYKQVATSIADLVAFHTIKRSSPNATRKRCSGKEETPLYVAMKLYGDTRKRDLVDKFYRLGLSISYDRMNAIITENANKLSAFYAKENVVCPPSLKKGLFTTAAVDNIDHNTSSSTSKCSFHGTAISLMQHCSPGQTGEVRTLPDEIEKAKHGRKFMKLPDHYSKVPACFVDVRTATCDPVEPIIPSQDVVRPLDEELPWLENTVTASCEPWSTHHADSSKTVDHVTSSVVLPLFNESAHDSAMMIHTINIVRNIMKVVDKDQTPVLVADQPLYALLKLIQFKFSISYGEKLFFVLMGGLHIEMAFLRVIGQYLNGSGWVSAIVEAGITTKGRADSMINASHVSRTRYAHQVTVAVLYALQKAAYNEFSNDDSLESMTFDEWSESRAKVIPQFKFWDTVMKLQLLLLQLVRSIRRGDFTLYKTALCGIVPWFFALDHPNYARWLSVHVRDLLRVHLSHPSLEKEFADGKFVARKTKRPFSCIALDHAHEQINKVIKGEGGIIGITHDQDSLDKWMLAAPELAAFVEEFERKHMLFTDASDDVHHSSSHWFKEKFRTDVEKLKEVIEELGNPFLEEKADLYDIDTKRIVRPEVVDTVFKIEQEGQKQYEEFVEQRLTTSKKKLMDPIKANKFPLFSTATKKIKCKKTGKITVLKNDCAMFGRLYTATSQHRKGDLDVFFAHENQAFPPSISEFGEIRPASAKSDIIKCLSGTSTDSISENPPAVSAKIYDGAAIVHMLSPKKSKTFQDYSNNIFLPYVRHECQYVSRVDFVWDQYNPESLKNFTRQNRGDGQRTRVALTTKIPKSWPCFLRDNENKDELFKLLALQMTSHDFNSEGKELYSTHGENVLCTADKSMSELSPCDHEEADTRIILHVADAVNDGHSKVMIRTVDSDVVVLAISYVLKIEGLEELWVHFGTDKNQKYIAAHTIATTLGHDKSKALPLFHALSGCDTVSSFNGKGKKTWWESWKAHPQATDAFLEAEAGDMDQALKGIERLVVVAYDRSSNAMSVNECRKKLFTQKDRLLENLPPTSDALKQHTLRAVYQGWKVWGKCLELRQQLPCPSNFGWQKEGLQWTPVWTTMPLVSDICIELVRCKRCKPGKECKGNCKCVKKRVKCTDFCSCGGDCNAIK